MIESREHIIDLDLPVSKRWGFLADYKSEINELLECYLNDFKGGEYFFECIELFKEEIISKEYLEEIEYIASLTKFTPNEVLIANLYYDVLKFYLGCTAFAVQLDDRILHSRNLDWWTDNEILSKYSRTYNFVKDGKTVFKTVGWLGFIGALSGTAVGKFSLTLNAVSSSDKPEIAIPVSFLLRDILSNADSFKEAKEKLEQTEIASDCLILLSGIKSGEIVVIERTPKRYATRTSPTEYIAVTNDYKKLENNSIENNLLQQTSCGRFNKTIELLDKQLPTNKEECMSILRDENVIMGITVQQMVFDNKNGDIYLAATAGSTEQSNSKIENG